MLVLETSAGVLSGADFRLDSIATQTGRSEVRFAGDTGFYYILWRGDAATDIRLATDLAASSGAESVLVDSKATNSTQFYRVEKVPLTSLRDTDGDGISDAWELLYRHQGAALNSSDRNEDQDTNGVADWLDALRESLRTGAVRGRPVLGAGRYHTLAIQNDGTLWGWGDNMAGELGLIGFTETDIPVQISAETNWVAVSAANLMSYGLKSDGSLWAWGQLGNPGSIFPLTQLGANMKWMGLPERSPPENPAFLREDGTRWQLAGSHTNLQPFGSGNDWAAVADGAIGERWAIKNDGTLWKGSNSFDTNRVWKSITLGLSQALALQTNGTLWAWRTGFNQLFDGELGLGNSFPSAPTQVGTDNWAALAAGDYHSVGIKSDGSLWWWGHNWGFENNGAVIRTNVPTRIGTNTDWLAVAAGNSHTIALRTDGTVWTFGANELGKSGNGTVALAKSPARVGADEDWSGIVVGTTFSFGLKTNGTLWAWGENSFGVLGLPDFTSSYVPRQIPGSNWLAVSGGFDHTVALQNDGSLWIWGVYVYTNGVHVFTNIPTRIGSDTDWKMVSAGRQHSLALKNDGSLWSWGINSRGELGTGVSWTPVPLRVGSALWTNVSAGHYNSLGVQISQTLWTWGQSISFGGFSQAPQNIDGTSFNWKVAANAKTHSSSAHALALKRNGTLWAWGSNSRGQIATNNPSSLPVQVGTFTNWANVQVGDLFSGGLQTDGSLWMTGFNWYGQLGFGTRNDTNAFMRVGTDTNWTAIAAGYRYMLVLKSDGSIWAWGDNSYGQCGQPALFEPSPVAGTNWGSPRR